MAIGFKLGKRWKLGALGVSGAGCVVLAVGMFGAGGASAYVGESYMAIPGIADSASSGDYRKWLQIQAHYWMTDEPAMGGRGAQGGQAAQGARAGRGAQAAQGAQGGQARQGGRRSRTYFSWPAVPLEGGRLAISVDKHNPLLRRLMAACAAKASMPEMKFAESADLARGLGEAGSRPADVPAFYNYALKDVQFSDCPVVDGAPEQAIVLSFKNAELLNFHPQASGEELKFQPAVLPLLKPTGMTKTFVLSWFAVANDVDDAQCPKVNAKPTEADYYAFVPKDEADKERADLAARKLAVNYENGQMSRRGPDRLNVGLLPGIVKDPGHVVPQTAFARGLDLDHNNGTGAPVPGTCKHVNYKSADGRTGIDNQLFTVEGCMPGYQGHKGFLMQYSNEQRRNGLLAILVQISGIDNMQNDDSVDITILYSKDHMAKDATGKQILADYTYRLTDNPEFTHYDTRLHGRIVNGVIVSDPVKEFYMHPGLDPEVHLFNAGIRMQIQPDGTMKGIIGGYQDWRTLMMFNTSSNSEQLYGFQAPGLYNAFKRYADGMKDPVTGQCKGISAAYDIEGSPAFIPPAQYRAMVEPGAAQNRKAH